MYRQEVEDNSIDTNFQFHLLTPYPIIATPHLISPVSHPLFPKKTPLEKASTQPVKPTSLLHFPEKQPPRILLEPLYYTIRYTKIFDYVAGRGFRSFE